MKSVVQSLLNNDRLRPYLDSWTLIKQDGLAIFGLITICIIILLAIGGPWISPYDPLATNPAERLLPPSSVHLFGTDEFGRDILSRILGGFRIDLTIAVSAVAGAFVIGTVVGAISGYFGGIFDDILMRCIDVIQSFPMLVLAMSLVAFLGAGMSNLILVTVVINIPIFARLMRAEILSRKTLDYVEAAICSGNSDMRVLFFHIYPNCSGPVIIQATLNLAWAILNVAALSFLGIGVRPPAPEWGVMVSEGVRFMAGGAWWVSFFPGLCIMLSVLAFNMFGDGLQEGLDPRRQR